MARLLAALVAIAGGLGVVAVYPGDLRAASADLVRLLDHVPVLIQQGLLGLVQVLAVATPVVLIAVAIWCPRPSRICTAPAGVTSIFS